MQTKSPPKRRITFTCPPDLVPVLEWRAKAEGRTVSNLIVYALRSLLASRDPSLFAPVHGKSMQSAEENGTSEDVA